MRKCAANIASQKPHNFFANTPRIPYMTCTLRRQERETLRLSPCSLASQVLSTATGGAGTRVRSAKAESRWTCGNCGPKAQSKAACMHSCMHGCMHSCMQGCMHSCMHSCMQSCIQKCMHGCMHSCMQVCMHGGEKRRLPPKLVGAFPSLSYSDMEAI